MAYSNPLLVGTGIGLRHPHVALFMDSTPNINWLEVHSENYLQENSKRRYQLRQIRHNYAISCHGIGLSLGSADGLNLDHIGSLKALFDIFALFVLTLLIESLDLLNLSCKTF